MSCSNSTRVLLLTGKCSSFPIFLVSNFVAYKLLMLVRTVSVRLFFNASTKRSRLFFYLDSTESGSAVKVWERGNFFSYT